MKKVFAVLLCTMMICCSTGLAEDLAALAGLYNALGTLSDDNASSSDQMKALGSMLGYMSEMEKEENAENNTQVSGSTVIITSSGRVNVRSTPKADGIIVGHAEPGKEYQYLGSESNGWLNIKLPDGTVGYISGKMGKVQESASVPSNLSSTNEQNNAAPVNDELVTVKLSSGKNVKIRKSVKEGLDAYEAFMSEYKTAMENLGTGDYSAYMSYLTKYTEAMEKIDKMQGDLTSDENLYYLDVTMRVLQTLY